MFIDIRKLPPNKIVDTDICIIGGGAAGITLAAELSNKPFRVCLLESGGLDSDPDYENLNEGISTGRNYDLKNSRARFFGGATNLWGGHCVPIRAIDFEARDWIPYSGWPFGLRELEPYYRRAHKLLKLGQFQYDAPIIASSLKLELFPFDPSKVESVVSRYNAMYFGLEFRDKLKKASNTLVYLYANAISINQSPDTNSIRDISVKTLEGKSFSVRSKYFVLAAGGIENPRLLLLSNNVQKNGVGNDNGLVGRFFMEHIWYPSGYILPARQDSLLNIYNSQHPYKNKCEIRCHIALPESLVKEKRIPSYRSEIDIQKIPPEAVTSARRIRDKVTNFKFPDQFSLHLAKIISDPNAVIRHLKGTKVLLNMYRVLNHVEQVPNPNSRVCLSPDRDRLGLNKAVLEWRLSEIDKQGILTAQRIIADEVGRSNFGRMRIEIPEDEEILLEGAGGGNHHMGTTRMHVDPRKGVVDADCRVHGLRNLFIAGPSVFPTCGFANPVLTIVALSSRLANHLMRIMAKEGIA